MLQKCGTDDKKHTNKAVSWDRLHSAPTISLLDGGLRPKAILGWIINSRFSCLESINTVNICINTAKELADLGISPPYITQPVNPKLIKESRSWMYIVQIKISRIFQELGIFTLKSSPLFFSRGSKDTGQIQNVTVILLFCNTATEYDRAAKQAVSTHPVRKNHCVHQAEHMMIAGLSKGIDMNSVFCKQW